MYMDPTLYRAVTEGKLDILRQNKDRLDHQLTPNKNTVLHIAAQVGRNATATTLLAAAAHPSTMLRAVNTKGDTALHVAAREGHSLVIKVLVQRALALDEEEEPENGLRIAQEIRMARNDDGDTALHEAVRSSIFSQDKGEDTTSYQASAIRSGSLERSTKVQTEFLSTGEAAHLEAVSLLMGPECCYVANNAGETPLYLAAESGYHHLVRDILRCCIEPAYEGPGGRTALHAAVISDNGKSTQLLLEWKKDLAREADNYGWTPLHYAAEFGYLLRVKQLLDSDASLAYLTTSDECGKNTALHIAARRGKQKVIEEMISQCPDCWEIVNGKGQNVFHLIGHYGNPVIKLSNNYPCMRSLINQKDVDGNTPLHISAMVSTFLYFPMRHFRVPKMSFNKANQTPLDLLEDVIDDRPTKELMGHRLEECGISRGRRNAAFRSKKEKEPFWMGRVLLEKKLKENMRRMEETHLVVATLVATVAFTAGITVPGGYNSSDAPNQAAGMAVLVRHAAFKAFVVANTAAMILSTCAVLVYFEVARTTSDDLFSLNNLASNLTRHSTLAMILSFITGSYAILGHSPSLAVPLCVVTSLYLAAALKLFPFLSKERYFKYFPWLPRDY